MKKRLLSGIQATGQMHIGNYLGAIQNWVAMQSDYDSFFMIADLHALTTSYEDSSNIKESTYQVVADLLACGIDPNNSTLFVQSRIPEHSELHLMLSMITPLPWLERVPTYKSKKEEIKGKDLNTYGFLGYPVLQAADILLYGAHVVPVGKDQAAHLELTREIARRFNHLFKTEFFGEPQEKYTTVPLLPGTDGRKMSKSYNNALYIADDAKSFNQKVMRMVTDTNRVRRDDPGDPSICPVYTFQEIFNEATKDSIASGCRQATMGCVDCKKQLLEKMNDLLVPIREKREELLADRKNLTDIIEAGSKKARSVANDTVSQIKDIIKLF
jgi:tryptophanyl-tRNA synthetase